MSKWHEPVDYAFENWTPEQLSELKLHLQSVRAATGPGTNEHVKAAHQLFHLMELMGEVEKPAAT